MLTGKRFRLKADTLAIESNGEERITSTVPAKEIIEVMSGPRPDDKRMVDVRWNGSVLVMFTEDVQGRGEQVADRRAGA